MTGYQFVGRKGGHVDIPATFVRLRGKDGSVISRAISLEEAEIVRDASCIPPIASIDELSADDMDGLADMYEGWAQSDLTDSANVARLLGWADGLRSLVGAVGTDCTPPTTYPNQEKSLLRFLVGKRSVGEEFHMLSLSARL
jgi:hypothetical protein